MWCRESTDCCTHSKQDDATWCYELRWWNTWWKTEKSWFHFQSQIANAVVANEPSPWKSSMKSTQLIFFLSQVILSRRNHYRKLGTVHLPPLKFTQGLRILIFWPTLKISPNKLTTIAKPFVRGVYLPRRLMSWSTTVVSAKVLISPSSSSWLPAIFRKILRMIFPLLVLGSPGAQWITSGAANAPICRQRIKTEIKFMTQIDKCYIRCYQLGFEAHEGFRICSSGLRVDCISEDGDYISQRLDPNKCKTKLWGPLLKTSHYLWSNAVNECGAKLIAVLHVF